MGIIHDSNSCCLRTDKKSVLEANLFEDSMQNSFLRGSSYESPIPDEVCVIETTDLKNIANYIDEPSTDVEKQQEVIDEPNKNRMNYSMISLGTGGYLKPTCALSRYKLNLN